MASPQVKGLFEKIFGPAAIRAYRLGYNLISALTLLPVLAVPALVPGDHIYQLSGPLLILSLAGQSFAIVILIVGLYQTGASEFLGIRQILSQSNQSDPELVVEGLYRWVRHPLYSGGLLFIWLTPIMTTSVLVLNLGLTAYIYIGSVFEERRLRREFGIAYNQYQREVPRLFPRVQFHIR